MQSWKRTWRLRAIQLPNRGWSVQDAEAMVDSLLRDSPLPDPERADGEIPEDGGSGKLPGEGGGEKLPEGGSDKQPK